jgi:hypothetical protein
VIRAAGLALTVLLLGGCGVRPTGVVYAGEAPSATASASPRSEVFLLDQGTPTPVPRVVGSSDPQLLFDALLRGPTPEELRRGLTTELSEVKWISVHDLGDRTLLVETIPPTLKLSPKAFAQIYCTGLMLSGRTVVKISYMDGGATLFPPPACPGVPAPPASPRLPARSPPAPSD